MLRGLGRCASGALCAYVRESLGEDVRPGIVVSIATVGDVLQWHLHLHTLATDGGLAADGGFHPLEVWDGQDAIRRLRERLLARLVGSHALSQELAATLLLWRHPRAHQHERSTNSPPISETPWAPSEGRPSTTDC